MAACATKTWARRSSGGGGFTLIELLAVMVVLAILVGVATASLSSMGDTRAAMAAKHLLRDLTFARQHAVATGRITWVMFDTTGNTGWEIREEVPATPGKANAALLTDPSTGGPFQQGLNTDSFIGVVVQIAAFQGSDLSMNEDVGFDWLGRPFVKDAVTLNGTGVVTLTGTHVNNVSEGTGYAVYIAP